MSRKQLGDERDDNPDGLEKVCKMETAPKYITCAVEAMFRQRFVGANILCMGTL